MRIVILVQPSIYEYHKEYGKKIKEYLASYDSDNTDISIIDIDAYSYDHECLNEITEAYPDIVITLDLSGFRFMTQSWEPALNLLYSKNLNLLWQSPAKYTSLLTEKKVSLSMIFFDMKCQKESLTDLYPNVDYYHPCQEESSFEERFANVWEEFLQASDLSYSHT